MPKRGAPSKPSPEPYVPIPDEPLYADMCFLCGDQIEPWPSEWCELIGPGERMAGWCHTRCVDEYNEFAAEIPFASVLQTPLF